MIVTLLRSSFAVLFLFCASVNGQGYTASIVGRITGPPSAPVQKALVSVTNEATGVRFFTRPDDDGAFSVTGLPPGMYSVSVEAADFATLTRTHLILEVSQTVRADLQLFLGTRESITVNADTGVLGTESGQLGQTITTREIQEIPLNGRNYLALNLLTPGTLPAAAGANPHNMNGARSDHVGYLLDGITNMQRRGNEQTVQPSLEVVQEFKALANSYPAEYGRMPGVISVALKSGTNDHHGSLFEYLRNDAMDARGFFDLETPKLKRNQFGGMAGGPVLRNRTFAIGSYEGLRSRAQQTHLANVPTAAQRNGIFTTPIRDPLNGTVLGPTIPAARIDQVARNLLEFVPLPNRTGAYNFSSVASIPLDWDVFTGKLDHNLGSTGRLAFQTVLGRQASSSPYRASDLPGFGSVSRARNQHWGLAFHRTFGSMALNEARFSFNRARFRETSVNAGRSTANEVGIAGAAPGSGLTNVVIANYTPFGDAPSLPSDWTDNNYNFSDTFSWSRGAHSLKAGGSFQRAQYFELFGAYTMGQLVFRNSGSGHPFADFLLGLPQTAQRQIGTNKAYLFSSALGFFAQDDWHMHQRLTLNLGLRYDLAQPPYEKHDRWANFIPSLGHSILAGEPGYPRSLLRTDRSNVAPRIGFAWRLGSSARTVLRAGYGIFYGSDLQFQTYQALGATAYPFTQLQLLQTSVARPLRLEDPFAAAQGINPAALSPNGVEYDNPTPYTQNWNLSVGREFGLGTAIEIGYVGSHSIHQSVAVNLNQTIRSPQGIRSPFPGFSRILQFRPAGGAEYDALQISARRRLATGLSFRAAFTWSKTIDNASFGSAARQPQNSLDLQSERGLADFHRTGTLATDVVYDLPFGRRRFSGGWQMAAIVLAYTGRPFTPTQTGTSTSGEPTRPDRVASGRLDQPQHEKWFDASAFRKVQLNEFRFGNSGRNILIGPGKFALDASVSKQFTLGERQRILFRAEVFNLPNHANFGDPITLVDHPSAGAIGSADPGRQIQFSLKYLF